MTAPRTLLRPLLLLAIIACSSAQFPYTTAPPGDQIEPIKEPLPSTWVEPPKPQTGMCGHIAEEWQVLKHHVKSLHGQGTMLEALSHHVRELTEHIRHLTERGEYSQ